MSHSLWPWILFVVGITVWGQESPANTESRIAQAIGELSRMNYAAARALVLPVAMDVQKRLGHTLPPDRLREAFAEARAENPQPRNNLEQAQIKIKSGELDDVLYYLQAALASIEALHRRLPVKSRYLNDGAYAESTSNPVLLNSAARLALESGDADTATQFNERSFTLIRTRFKPPMSGFLLHRAHTTRGMILAAKNDWEQASAELRRSVEAADASGWPQGPGMVLAQRLLEAGQTKSVLDYLDACGQIGWTAGSPRLEAWKAAVRSGVRPTFDASSLAW